MIGVWMNRKGRRRFFPEASPSLDLHMHTNPIAARQGRALCNRATDADGGLHTSSGTRPPTPERIFTGVGECRSSYRSVVAWWRGDSVKTTGRSAVSQPGRALQQPIYVRVPARPLEQQCVALARPVMERSVDVGEVAPGASANGTTIDYV